MSATFGVDKPHEPFLQHGSSDGDVDVAIIQLWNLADDNLELAREACEFIAACVKNAERATLQSRKLAD